MMAPSGVELLLVSSSVGRLQKGEPSAEVIVDETLDVKPLTSVTKTIVQGGSAEAFTRAHATAHC